MKYGRAASILVAATLVACSSSSSTTPGDDAGRDDADNGVDSGAPVDSGSSTPTLDARADTGSSPGAAGSATVTGSITGFTLPVPQDAITFNQSGKLTLRITDYANSCTLLAANDEHKQNSKYLQLYLDAYPGQPAVHTIDGTTYQAIFYVRDATCASTRDNATGGTVSIASVSASAVTGSFDLTFAGGSVQGTFDAPICNGGQPEGSGGACVP